MRGIQNQYAPNAYIRLWSCLEGFRRDDLTRAYEDASVVQGTLMRGTIHTVARTDYRLFLGAVARTQREWAGRATKAPANLEPSAALARVRADLAGGPMKRPALVALLADEHPAVRFSIDTDLGDPAGPPIGHLGAAPGRPVRPRRRRHRSGRRGAGGRRAARRRRALPRGLRARRRSRDVAAFLGMKRFAGEGRRLHPGAPRGSGPRTGASSSTSKTGCCRIRTREAPVRFLPTWDAILLVHARRTQVLPEAYRPLVFHTKMPPSYPTFLVDGQVAGTWRHADGEIRLSPFGKLRPGDRVALEEEAHELAAFHA